MPLPTQGREGSVTRRFRLLLSGSCALLSAVLCLAYGEHIREESERVRAEALERYGGEVVTLVVATEGIEAGESVSRSNASERDWLVDLAPENAVTGLDAVLDIVSWKNPEEIMAMCRFVAVSRYGYSPKKMEELPEGLRTKIIPLEIPLLAISSTELRERARNGRSIRFMVPPAVEKFIRKKSLYRNNTEE